MVPLPSVQQRLLELSESEDISWSVFLMAVPLDKRLTVVKEEVPQPSVQLVKRICLFARPLKDDVLGFVVSLCCWLVYKQFPKIFKFKKLG